jgi:hypothetical protein
LVHSLSHCKINQKILLFSILFDAEIVAKLRDGGKKPQESVFEQVVTSIHCKQASPFSIFVVCDRFRDKNTHLQGTAEGRGA